MTEQRPARRLHAARPARRLATLGGLLAALGLSACGGDTTLQDMAAPAALVDVQPETAGANCGSGGSRVESGLDANRNGTLDSAEIASTQYVCNGAGGSSGAAGATGATGATGTAGFATLVLVTDAGVHCAAGGKAVSVGRDANVNAALDASEVASTDYVCNGSAGATGAGGAAGSTGAAGANGLDSLLSTVAEPSGANCQWGGMKTTSGLDANRNHVLDASEIASTTYVCNGAPAASANVVDVTGTTVQAQANTSYLADSASPVTVTLPTNPSVGDVVIVSGVGMGGWRIAQNAGQRIYTGYQDAAWSGLALQPFQGNGVAVSGNGQVLVLGGFFTDLQVSVDGGATWTDEAGSGSNIWDLIGISYDGSHILATGNGNGVTLSTDGGSTWQATALGSAYWSAFAISGDGSHMAAVPYGGDVRESTDGGLTWVDASAAGNRLWNGIAISDDGMKQVASEQGGALWLSTDGGLTWAQSSAPTGQNWGSVHSSADGVHLFAATYGGYLYTSADSGPAT
ncbi:MAG: WD40/YVTN/BNR-like repeat-containing protein [Vitreoscilla sp.]